MKKLAVIVPCYNEEAVIEESYRRTKEVLVKLPNPTEIIYINDGSQDKTRSLLDHIAATDPHVKVIHFSRNFGHQPAVTAGINNCDADLAIIIDADMQDPPELIPDLLEVQERENANVVYCVRKPRIYFPRSLKRSNSFITFRSTKRKSPVSSGKWTSLI